jgi:hypothetical protein
VPVGPPSLRTKQRSNLGAIGERLLLASIYPETLSIKEMKKRSDFLLHDMQYNILSGIAKMATFALEKTEAERKQKDQLSLRVKEILQIYEENENGGQRKRPLEP